MNRRVIIVLELDPDQAPETPTRRAQLTKPFVLTQVARGRVRVERGGAWSRVLFRSREHLAAALLAGAADARAGALDCGGLETATGVHYTTMADFLADAAIAVLNDDRIGKMWPS